MKTELRMQLSIQQW